MSEIKALEAVNNALETLNPDERARVLNWAQLKYGAPAPNHSIPDQSKVMQAVAVGTPVAKSKTSKKAKTIISMDKNLNLSPQGKISAVQFATEKSPSSLMQKCVVGVYYLRETIGMSNITAQAVFTFFKHLSWPAPADLKNTLQQAGSAGWLDTANSEDIKLTSLGENLVEHDLPVKAKTK